MVFYVSSIDESCNCWKETADWISIYTTKNQTSAYGAKYHIGKKKGKNRNWEREKKEGQGREGWIDYESREEKT